jgi:hypothetical protein
LVASATFFAWLSVYAMAQQPANQPPAGRAPAGAAGAAIGLERQLKATILTFQDGKLAAEHHYYWWRDGCYVRYQSSGNHEAVPPDACR